MINSDIEKEPQINADERRLGGFYEEPMKPGEKEIRDYALNKAGRK